MMDEVLYTVKEKKYRDPEIAKAYHVFRGSLFVGSLWQRVGEAKWHGCIFNVNKEMKFLYGIPSVIFDDSEQERGGLK